MGVAIFLKQYEQTGSIRQRSGSGHPSKIAGEIKGTVEQEIKTDDETTAYQLHQLLVSRGYNFSIRTALRCRKQLGWTFCISAYCQVIREPNREKRFLYALANIGYDLIHPALATLIYAFETLVPFWLKFSGVVPVLWKQLY